MKQILKQLAKRITSVLDRMGEDFDMLLLEDILLYPPDVTQSDLFDDELFV